LAAVTAASAQSTTTISGLVRAGFQKDISLTASNHALIKATAATDAGKGAAVSSGNGLSTHDININIGAVEDLGGGLKASFFQNLETDPQRGAALTRADSGIDLAGGFGTVGYRNTRSSDLISGIGSSAINMADGLYHNSGIVGRIDQDVLSYTSPAIMPGLNASVAYFEGNNGQISLPVTNKTTVVLALVYADGPLAVRGTYKMKPANAAASSGLTPKANFELAVVYDLGVAKVGFAYDAASVSGVSSAAASTAASGGSLSAVQAQAIANLQTKSATGFTLHVPVGAVSLGLGYFTRGDQTITEFGARYDLSKRTYVSAASGKKAGLFNNDGFQGSQYRVAMTHAF